MMTTQKNLAQSWFNDGNDTSYSAYPAQLCAVHMVSRQFQMNSAGHVLLNPKFCMQNVLLSFVSEQTLTHSIFMFISIQKSTTVQQIYIIYNWGVLLMGLGDMGGVVVVARQCWGWENVSLSSGDALVNAGDGGGGGGGEGH